MTEEELIVLSEKNMKRCEELIMKNLKRIFKARNIPRIIDFAKEVEKRRRDK